MWQIKYIAPLIIGLSSVDSFLKEEAWTPPEARQIAFYILGPLIAGGVVLLIPYIKSRVAIVVHERASSFALAAAVVVSAVQLVVWALMYYQVEVVSVTSISTIAWFLKDIVLVSSAVIFGLLANRLIRWYALTRNRVVLLFGGFVVGNVLFAILHVLPEFLGKPLPFTVTRAIGIAFIFLLWSGLSALMLLNRTYYGRALTLYVIPVLVPMALATITVVSGIIPITLDPNLRTITVLGLAVQGPVYASSYFRLVPAVLNSTAKDYYRGVGYGMGLLAAATCGMGLGIPTVFPLSGFPSLSMLLPGASLDFAAFTSCASYFSIQEEVRKQIRQAEGFVSSLGEAESRISTERQVTQFYDKFTSMARESRAVEEGAINKNEIYQYAKALKKIQIANAK